MSVDTVIWPAEGAVPTGNINPGAYGGGTRPTPFAVLHLDPDAKVQFNLRRAPAEQARWLRALAEVATELADELDPQDGAEA